MPIFNIQLVANQQETCRADLAQVLADRLGDTLKADAGRVWVRFEILPADHYAENNVRLQAEELPVFVTVLHAHPPEGATRAQEVAALTAVVASCTARRSDRVHIEYAPPGAGRIAFGGKLVL